MSRALFTPVNNSMLQHVVHLAVQLPRLTRFLRHQRQLSQFSLRQRLKISSYSANTSSVYRLPLNLYHHPIFR